MTQSAPEALILCIGDEVLRGEVTNTNAAWLGAELSSLGFRVAEHRAVADREAAIVEAFTAAMSAAPLVVATGGLGPTGDDLTVDAAAKFMGVRVHEDQAVLETIARRQGRPIAEVSFGGRRMTRVPDGAEVLPNSCGAAPGVHLARAGRHLFLLPGVPHEMKAIFSESIAAIVAQAFPDRLRRTERYWLLANWPESDADTEARKTLGSLIGPGRLEFGTLLGRGWVTLRAVGEGAEGERLLAEAHRLMMERFADTVFSTDKNETLEAVTARELLTSGLTLAMAESCTGGLLASRLVSTPGISAALLESLVTYSNQSKQRLLGVPEAVLAAHGAVSRECAEAMATGLRERSGADITLSVTGIAGPEGGTPAKPVGTVHFALASAGGVEADSRRLGGSRDWIRERAAAHGLWMLWRAARQSAKRK